MKKFALLVLCLLLLCGCRNLDEKPPEVVENSKLLIGIWQLTTCQPDEGEAQDLTDKDIVFTYYDDFSGNQTVGGKEEYICTYNYDGKILNTSIAYSDESFAVKRDLITIDGDRMTLYSYDEKATYTLQRIGVPATKTTAPTTATEDE